jgi:hypothetical protein
LTARGRQGSAPATAKRGARQEEVFEVVRRKIGAHFEATVGMAMERVYKVMKTRRMI